MKKWRDLCVGLIGIWFTISAFIHPLGKSSVHNFYNHLILGIILLALGLWEFLEKENGVDNDH